VLLRKRGEVAEAKAAYRQALTIGEKLATDAPDRADLTFRLAASQVNFANLLSRYGDFAEAVEWYDKATTLLNPLVKAAGPADASRALRTAHWGRADALDGLGRSTDALADRERVVELSSAGDQPAARAPLARTLALAGRVGRAVAEADDLAAQPNCPADYLYAVACVYSLSADRDPANRDAHTRKCLRLLGAAVDGGFTDASRLEADADLKSVRNCVEFRKLLARLPAAPNTDVGGK
jgi:tetratricopeptide (TPR) repeat protein